MYKVYRKTKRPGVLALGVLFAVIAAMLATSLMAQPEAAAMQKKIKPYPHAPVSFTELVDRVKDVVVNISTTKIIKRRPFPHPFGRRGPFRDFFGDDFFERFFGQMPREQKQRSLGSGFIIDPDRGYILTNNHVVANADEIVVKLDDGKEIKAEIVGRDPKTDLALIRAKGKLHVSEGAPLGDSDKVKVGEWVMAIGNPFGLERTVTVGIISAKGRVIGAGPYDDFLQTDAAINPGNSGGPLFNMKGEVIGINTAIVASGQGIGFAIPINIAKTLLPQLEKGKVIRGWLGVSIQEVTPELAKSFGLKQAGGALVADVIKNSPAEKSGIKRGDIIVKFGNESIESPHELSRVVAGTKPGERIKVGLIREGKQQTVTVKIGTMPEKLSELTAPTATELGISVQTLSPELAVQLDLPKDEKGVVITDVTPGGPGDDAGLQRGDVIKEVNRHSIQSVSEYKDALEEAKGKDTVLFLVRRGSQTFYVTVKPVPE
ncbi:MAG: DegQ family serine endoprotease [Deltaproteobacteria bacterium]|nr:DegQ family serine endoprotease [Deltaproteobacteria bacterium]MBW2072248.1 DegQ family serine endoprotease [Deltaproteobacteria bacterium]